MAIHMQKGMESSLENMILIIGGVAAAILVSIYAYNKYTEFIHGACVSNMQQGIADFAVAASDLKNEGDSAYLPIRIGDCVEGVLFTNKKEFAKMAGISTESDFSCRGGYESMIVGFPVINKGTLSWWGSVIKNFRKEDYMTVLREVAQSKVKGLELSPFCLNLAGKGQAFENKAEIKGSGKEEMRCLRITRLKGDKFKVEGDKTPVTEQGLRDCKEKAKGN